MKIEFKNPHDEEFVSSITIPFVGFIAFPIRSLRLCWALRKIARMPPERAERAVLAIADEFERRGMHVTREETKVS